MGTRWDGSHLLIDFKKTYDFIIKEKINNIPVRFGILRRLVQLLRRYLSDPIRGMQICQIASKFAENQNSVKPCLHCSLTLQYKNFNIMICDSKNKKEPQGTNIERTEVADDVDLIRSHTYAFQSSTYVIVEACEQIGCK